MDDGFDDAKAVDFNDLPDEVQDMIAGMLATVDQGTFARASRQTHDIVASNPTHRKEMQRRFSQALNDARDLLTQIAPTAPRRPRWGPAVATIAAQPGAAATCRVAADEIIARLDALELGNQALPPASRVQLSSNYTNAQAIRYFAGQFRGAVARLTNRGG